MLRFLHGYIPEMWPGLVRRGLIDDTSGIKFHQVIDTPEPLRFNSLAKEGGELYEIIRECNRPFYLDRLQGGWWFYEYDFDMRLLNAYREQLGEWMLGLQMHEWASNMHNDWQRITSGLKPGDSLTDPDAIRRAVTQDCHNPGVRRPNLESASPEEYAAMTPPATCEEALAQYDDLFAKRQKKYAGLLLPADSYYMAVRQEIAMDARALMPEIGGQIALVRWQLALARGMARAYGIPWGTYYEPWGGDPFGCAYYKHDFVNEWGVKSPVSGSWPVVQFTPTSGSSRLLQRRIYLYSLLSGAQFMSEEWGSSNTFYDWNDFELTPYGTVKRDFLRFAAAHPDLGNAYTPVALVLPREFEIFDLFFLSGSDRYLDYPIEEERRRAQFTHIRAALNRLMGGIPAGASREESVLTTSPLGDVFDIVYEDVPEAALEKYDFIVDLTLDHRLPALHSALAGRMLDGRDPDKTCSDLERLLAALLPCRVKGNLTWLLNRLADGQWALGLFNNSGVIRTRAEGDRILPEADMIAEIETNGTLSPIAPGNTSLTHADGKWFCRVPAGDVVVLRLQA